MANDFNGELYRSIKELDIEKLNELDKIELLNFFRAADNPLIRDRIALIFSDLQYHKAVPDIIARIMDNRTTNDKGTLVYALDNLDCREHFLPLVQVIGEMDYESRLMAYGVIEKNVKLISSETRRKAIDQLEQYRVHLEATSDDLGNHSPLHFVEKTKEMLEETDGQ